MRETQVKREFSKSPDEVWPILSDLDRWLEPGVRWRLDQNASQPGKTIIARLWERPGTSSLVTVELEQTDDGGSAVTITEQQDRHFELDANLSIRHDGMNNRSGKQRNNTMSSLLTSA